MRLKIDLDGNGLVLPLNYRHLIQGWIYQCVKEEDYGRFLHDQGYQGKEKRFKLFVFSDLSGKYSIQNRCISFASTVSLSIASQDPTLLQRIYEQLLKHGTMQLADRNIKVIQIRLLPDWSFKNVRTVTFETLSPVTAYRFEGDHTRYFSPENAEFWQICMQNLNRKAETVFTVRNEKPCFEKIRLIRFHKQIVHFKKTFYEAYSMRFEADLNAEALNLLMNTGLSSKGSAGFGMLNIVK